MESESVKMLRQGISKKLLEATENELYNIVKADMTKRLPFEDSSFDMIFHPVSNCYVEDVYHIWNECFRILKNGGILLAGMNNGLDYLVEEDNPLLIVNKLPYNPFKDKVLYDRFMREYEQSGGETMINTDIAFWFALDKLVSEK